MKQGGIDFLRVYPGLNDFCDALEAIPLQLIGELTLVNEIDAKCIEAKRRLSKLISEFLNASETEKKETLLAEIRQYLREIIPCLEEKMHVAGKAALLMERHAARLESDYAQIVDQEIPKRVQIVHDDPAFMEIRTPEAAAGTRAERRETTRKRATTNEATESPVSRAETPPAPRRRRGTPQQPPPDAPRKGTDVYCYCSQGSYGDMVGCDGPDCKREWFHLTCIGLSAPPKGQWLCEECQAKYRWRQ